MLCEFTFINFSSLVQQLCYHVETPLLKDHFLLFIFIFLCWKESIMPVWQKRLFFFSRFLQQWFFQVKLEKKSSMFCNMIFLRSQDDGSWRQIHGRKRAEKTNRAQQHEKASVVQQIELCIKLSANRRILWCGGSTRSTAIMATLTGRMASGHAVPILYQIGKGEEGGGQIAVAQCRRIEDR